MVDVKLDVVLAQSGDHPVKSGVLAQRRIYQLRDMRFSCQLLLGQFRCEAGYSPVIQLALREKLAEAHGCTGFGKERILGIEIYLRGIAVEEGPEDRQVPLSLGTAQVGKNLLG